jgi:hypothetical protein
MKTKTYFTLCFVTVCFLSNLNVLAQNARETEDALNSLVKGLETNPENPLNIDKEFLSNFSRLLPEGSLKNALQSYGSNFGIDKDLSTRQIYWDIASGFDQNKSIINNNQYGAIGLELNLMFDNYNLLSDKLKSIEGDYEFGSFINDPAVISSLANITGSYENAQAMGLGIEFIAGFSEAMQEAQKYKDDYRKLAALSTKNLYAETDPNLTSALIDAYVGIEGYQIITPMYRYDFSNGASLRVENGILKFFNASKGTVKNLLLVDKRHDGNFYKYKNMRGGFYSTILISPDEKVIYLYVNPDVISDMKCTDCLEKSGYTLNTNDGEIIFAKSGWMAPTGYEVLNDTRFDSNNDPVRYNFSASMGFFSTSKIVFKSGFKMTKESLAVSGLDKEKKFQLNNVNMKFKNDNSFQESLFNYKVKVHYLYEKDDCTINLFWANSNKELDKDKIMYSSSMLQIAKGKTYYNADGMINQLTGIAMTRSGDLYFTGKNGSIGKLNGSEFKLDDPALTATISAAMNKKVFASYNFIGDKNYISTHGQISSGALPLYPSLKFTPDEKLLVYIVNDNLYIVNPVDFGSVKRFKLLLHPYNYYFTKENGDWVINIQALNEFKFPITKKYSINKLVSGYDAERIRAINKESNRKDGLNSTNKSTETNFSLADEIKKLKELLDSGVITQEEFETAKKKLLSR